ncbi:lanthionine synthetase LanC family protein [Proteiniphilum sp.]|uniref:lanthionine synthetase LanC family protein n=1 Tax=Proteiniphilum sp. TaxID=1926877 RepID=UPI0033234738
MTKLEFGEIERTTHHLILNTYFMPDIGLFHGQMGIALTFSEYSRYTGNEIYLEVSTCLLDNIMEKIDKNLTFSFGSGLSGIGWGIEYLIQHGFVEGESVEVCEEIDRKIMEVDPRRIIDTTLDTGMEGLLHYVIYHLQGASNQNTELPFDDKYLSDLFDIGMNLKDRIRNTPIASLLDIYLKFYSTRTIHDYNSSLTNFISPDVAKLSDNIVSSPLGIKDGLAGKLLKTIS